MSRATKKIGTSIISGIVPKSIKVNNMLYFSSLLKTILEYAASAGNLFTALSKCGEEYTFFDGAKDIWAKDYMPVKTGSSKYISFRYEPCYLKDDPQLKTDFKNDVAPKLSLPVIYSNINLDGGNIVFSPSQEKAIISDRVFSENPESEKSVLISELENRLEAEIIIIPSLKSDMTGHADGVVRFVDEKTVIGNATPYKNGYGISAVGSYLNFLETQKHIFLPVFGVSEDESAIKAAKCIFAKEIIAVNINDIAQDGGVLNCISWETTV